MVEVSMNELKELLQVCHVRRIHDRRWQELLFERIRGVVRIWLRRDRVCEIEVLENVTTLPFPLKVWLHLIIFEFLEYLEGFIYNLLLIPSVLVE
jgi:hypothetical protein